MPEECGSEMPAAAYAYCVRPEQSKASGPAAAHTYGSPSWASAVSTATCAAAVGATIAPAGTLGGGSGPGTWADAGTGLRATPAPATRTTSARRTRERGRRDGDVLATVMTTGSPVLHDRLPS